MPEALKSATLIMAFTLALCVVLFLRQFLDAKYFYDGEKIQALAQDILQVPEDPSFQTVGEIYRSVGLADRPTIAALVGFLFFSILWFSCLRISVGNGSSWVNILLQSATIVLASVYLGTYSKDLATVALALAILYAPRARRGEIVIILSMFLYALALRDYWVAVAFLYLVLVLVLTRKATLLRLLVVVFLGLGAFSTAYFLLFAEPIESVRIGVNSLRQGSEDARTVIETLLTPNGPLTSWFNSTLIWLTLILPAPLILAANPFYLVASGFLIALFLAVGRQVRHLSPVNVLQLRAVAAVAAFVTVQALFEPDYGSYIRHLTPMLPLVLLTQASTISPDGSHRESRPMGTFLAQT